MRYLSPLQSDLGEALGRFRRVVVVEMNHGHLRGILRDRFLIDAAGLNKIQGRPFRVAEIIEVAHAYLGGRTPEELRA